jgi:nanoRNase/pAp phosphatase (c-di-AMP/oligoRNAs hydrolase)
MVRNYLKSHPAIVSGLGLSADPFRGGIELSWERFGDVLYVVQTHDQPDADAICSGYIVQRLLAAKGRRSILVFGGQLVKAEYTELINGLSMVLVPIGEAQSVIGNEAIVHITVDCLPGGLNVTPLPEVVTVLARFAFDHHRHDLAEVPEDYCINSEVKSCTVVLYENFRNVLKFISDSNAYTALYYGLQRDTNNFEHALDPISLQVKQELETSSLLNEKMLQSLESNCISADDLNRMYAMVAKRQFVPQYPHVCYVWADDNTDPNILGKTADLIIGTTGIDIVVMMSYQKASDRSRLSVRSYDRFFSAVEVVRAIGEGGGHATKAGGILKSTSVAEDLAAFFNQFYLIEVGQGIPNLEFKRFQRKKGVSYVFIPLYKLYDRGTVLETHSSKRLLVDGNVAIVNTDGTLYTMPLDIFKERFDEAPYDEEGALLDLPIFLNRISVAVTMRAVLRRPGPPVRVGVLDKKAKVISHVDRYYSEEAKCGDLLMVWDNGHLAAMKPASFERLYEAVPD